MQPILLQSISNLFQSNILFFLLTIAAVILIWLLIRELLTWYWKINKIVGVLERIETGIDFLATKYDQANNEPAFIETPAEIIKPLITEVVDNESDKTNNK